MILFGSDLDNTLIYSYRHDIGPNIFEFPKEVFTLEMLKKVENLIEKNV